MSPKNLSKCVVNGCKSKDVVVHRFPNPKLYMDRLLEWLDILGIVNCDPLMVYKNKFVCAAHFASDCSSPGTIKLNAKAKPTLNLPPAMIVSPSCIDEQLKAKPSSMSTIIEKSNNDDVGDCDISGINLLNTNDELSAEEQFSEFPILNNEHYDNVTGCNVSKPEMNDCGDISDINILDSSVQLAELVDDMYNASVGTSSQTNAAANKRDYAQKSTATKKQFGLLEGIGVKKCSMLTPKCRKLYSVAKNVLKKYNRSKSSKKLFKSRLQAAEKFADTYLYQKLSDKLTAAASLFTKLQLRETKKKNKGQRFTLDEKMLSLSLYKRSPKCYRLLSQLFVLPSKRTLNNILNCVTIGPGICPLMMDVLKDHVKKLRPSERYCTILFDEVCLSSGLSYNSVTDQIDGFVNTGKFRSQNVADHALVFMIRGIQKKYKQPIAYSFCQGATKQDELVHQLKEVIRNVHDTGLRVLATISDQGTANVAAINILKRDTRAYQLKNNMACTDEFYEVEVDNLHRLKLVHIFDVPHLIKCIRNNLVTKDLIFCTNGVQKRAKWSHILELYNEDCKIPDCKMLPRLSDNHVIPDKIFKMKVKCAAQVFSQRVSSTMNFLASRNIISPDAVDTAFVCQFFDNLFDSLNGSFDKIVDGKKYRTAVKKNSPHHELWDQSLKILSTMRFINKNGKTMSVPTIRNWISTIKSFQTLYKVLQSINIRSFLPRHINQDSLENFFGAIRSVGSTNPNCNAFIMAYKTLVLNNLVSPQSPGANCEEDFTEGSLSSFRNLFDKAKHFQTETSSCINTAADFSETTNQLSLTTAFVQGQTKTFIAGYILKKLNKDLFKNCKYCLNLLCSTNVSKDHQLISAREYKSSYKSLKYPSLSLKSIVHNIISYVGKNMPVVCHHENIFYNLCNNVHNIFNFDDILNCPEHHKIFPIKIVEIVVKLMINHYCTEINRILLGKKKVRQNENDPIKKIANAWHLKHSKRKVQGKFNLVS